MTPHYNAGVMLIDVNLWKEKLCKERLVKYLTEENGNKIDADQGIINEIFKSDIEQLAP